MVKETMVKDIELAKEASKKLLTQLDNSHFRLQLALWVYFKEENRWQLVLATPQYDILGPLGTYSKIQKILRLKENEEIRKYIELQDIIILSPKNNFVKEIKKNFHEGQSGNLPISASGSINETYTDAYFYRVS